VQNRYAHKNQDHDYKFAGPHEGEIARYTNNRKCG
jgi:hypothetical protein